MCLAVGGTSQSFTVSNLWTRLYFYYEFMTNTLSSCLFPPSSPKETTKKAPYYSGTENKYIQGPIMETWFVSHIFPVCGSHRTDPCIPGVICFFLFPFALNGVLIYTFSISGVVLVFRALYTFFIHQYSSLL